MGRKHIAVIGSGISGLAAAYLLRQQYDVTLYEQEGRAGGHARTLEVNYDGQQIAVDTGFIVFNFRNYPHLTGLFRELDVAYHKSDMSFAASINEGEFEYSSKSLRGIFPTWQSLTDTKRMGMLRDYFRFSRYARNWLHSPQPEPLTLGTLLDRSQVGEAFRRYFILPMGAAIWSCPVSQMLAYPARTFVQFFENHGLLGVNDQPQWYTVTGGSRQYVDKIIAKLGGGLRLNAGVVSVRREAEGVIVEDRRGESRHYDQVVMASHADQSLAMLERPTEAEQSILSAFRFQENDAILHGDTSIMPKEKRCWASWVYHSQHRVDDKPRLAVSYWMNCLQSIPDRYPLFVTLNSLREPDPARVFDRTRFTHPIFDQAAIDAQEKLPEIQGNDRIWYCGAWQRYGFHEDGIRSAVAVAEALGVTPGWTEARA